MSPSRRAYGPVGPEAATLSSIKYKCAKILCENFVHLCLTFEINRCMLTINKEVLMAYEHVRLDLRKKPFRRRKFYWRAVREGRLPWPKWKKPRYWAIKLDPEQAILGTCMNAPTHGAWIIATGAHKCAAYPSAGAYGPPCPGGRIQGDGVKNTGPNEAAGS